MEKMRVIRLIKAETISSLQDEVNKFFILQSGNDPHVTVMSTDIDYDNGRTIYLACIEYNITKNATEKK